MRAALVIAACVYAIGAAAQPAPGQGYGGPPPTGGYGAPQSGYGAPPGQPQSGQRMRPQDRFDAANVTHDGRLTRDQAQASGWGLVAHNFDQIDTDHKGYVTMQDLHNFFRARRAARQGATGGPPPGAMGPGGPPPGAMGPGGPPPSDGE